MQIGKMYKPAVNHSAFRVINYPFCHVYVTDEFKSTHYPLKDLIIVVLKLSQKTYHGTNLLGKDSFRVTALLPDGRVGDIYLTESEWEQL
jgi:hypothetical protein